MTDGALIIVERLVPLGGGILRVERVEGAVLRVAFCCLRVARAARLAARLAEVLSDVIRNPLGKGGIYK